MGGLGDGARDGLSHLPAQQKTFAQLFRNAGVALLSLPAFQRVVRRVVGLGRVGEEVPCVLPRLGDAAQPRARARDAASRAAAP